VSVQRLSRLVAFALAVALGLAAAPPASASDPVGRQTADGTYGDGQCRP